MFTRRFQLTLLACLCAMLAFTATQSGVGVEPASLPAPANRPVDFAADVRPIFEQACFTCHGPAKQRSGFRLDRKAAALKGGELGTAIVAGKSAESPLVRYVAGLEEGLLMPPEGKRLTSEQIAVLRRWIDDGATWPDDGSTNENRLDWWSLRPIQRSPLPAVPAEDQAWSRSLIDHFVTAKWREKKLVPSPAADHRVLIRRVAFDLLGLPPTPDDVTEFAADSVPDTLERLTDRWLASPRYGERWARHWMDVVHFAETHGHDQDRVRPNAWPYRDYLIHAFNADLPYGMFIEQQLAADALFPDNPQAIAALGFLAAGPWDESSLRDIRDDTLDRQVAYYLDRDDMVTTAMSTFTSSTVHCARCHDHKFDPISQHDYYSLQAVFAGIGRANRPFDLDPKVSQQRQTLKTRLAAIERRDMPTLAPLLDTQFAAELAAWEAERGAEANAWVVLDPSTITSAQGSTLTKLSDLSILSGGTRPEKDTYTLVAKTNLPSVTAVRLELLTDESLSKAGPGRQDNGNLHLSEFRVATRPVIGSKNNGAAPPTAEFSSAVLQNPTADFNQAGWTIQHALDGNPATAWGIYPEVGKPHQAVVEFKQPIISGPDGIELKFDLEQLHGGGHLIGRLRLSATKVAQPQLVGSFPAELAAILAVPRAQRTMAQQESLILHFLRQRTERELAALPPAQMVFAGAGDFVADGTHRPVAVPRPVHVLKRGDIRKPGEAVVAGSLSCIATLPGRFELPNPDQEASRRAALARWISSSHNPLTWRSIVNRVWHYHFGRGLSETPNDFGRMGAMPSHPELLDRLAADFLSGGDALQKGDVPSQLPNHQSLKRLHRAILTSATYRQSSAHNATCAEIDGDNRFLWRMNRSRLDAESVRDAILQVTDRIDWTMGGPSAQQFSLKPGIHVTPLVNYNEFNWSGLGSNRRSVYRFIFRTLPDPFMDCLDCADASQLTAVRNVSVSPLQSLSMLNNEFMLTYSELLARRLQHETPAPTTQLATAFQLTFGRWPTREELSDLQPFLTKHGLPALCRVLLNSNEFMFVE